MTNDKKENITRCLLFAAHHSSQTKSELVYALHFLPADHPLVAQIKEKIEVCEKIYEFGVTTKPVYS